MTTKRLRFHFPLYFVKNNELHDADYFEARAELIRRWSAVCDSFNSYKSRLFNRGFEYDEEVFVIYCDDDIHPELAKIFADVVSKYHDHLWQECYIYEEDTVQVKVHIKEADDKA